MRHRALPLLAATIAWSGCAAPTAPLFGPDSEPDERLVTTLPTIVVTAQPAIVPHDRICHLTFVVRIDPARDSE